MIRTVVYALWALAEGTWIVLRDVTHLEHLLGTRTKRDTSAAPWTDGT